MVELEGLDKILGLRSKILMKIANDIRDEYVKNMVRSGKVKSGNMLRGIRIERRGNRVILGNVVKYARRYKWLLQRAIIKVVNRSG